MEFVLRSLSNRQYLVANDPVEWSGDINEAAIFTASRADRLSQVAAAYEAEIVEI
jgi:hypothetical protein